MATFHDPMALLRKNAALFPKVEAKVRLLHAQHVRQRVTETERDLLSGGISTKELANMGHPYARRKFSKRGYQRESLKGGQRLSTKVRGRNAGFGQTAPSLPINAQNGELRRSLKVKAVAPPPGGQAFQMGFTAPYAKYILAEKGTRYMKARGFQAAKRKTDKKANKELENRIRKTLVYAAATGRI